VCPLCSDEGEYRELQERDERNKQDIRNIQQLMIQAIFYTLLGLLLSSLENQTF
jgi:hypothetical protein